MVSPLRSPSESRERQPQGNRTAQRVKDAGASESRPVAGRIGVEPTGDITPLERGPTSRWSSVTREPRPTDSGGQADMSAAEMLAGAAPGRAPDWKVWWTVRRHPARIVKVAVKAAASREGRS